MQTLYLLSANVGVVIYGSEGCLHQYSLVAIKIGRGYLSLLVATNSGGYMMLPPRFKLKYPKGIAFLDLSSTILQAVTENSGSCMTLPPKYGLEYQEILPDIFLE